MGEGRKGQERGESWGEQKQGERDLQKQKQGNILYIEM